MPSEFFKKRFAVLEQPLPPRVTPHDVVKNAYDTDDISRRCIFCTHYALSLKAQTCLDCLSTEHLDNFNVVDYVKDKLWYQYNVGKMEEQT